MCHEASLLACLSHQGRQRKAEKLHRQALDAASTAIEMSSNEGLMADPYASSSGAPPPSSVPTLPPGAGWAASVQPQLQASNSPDFLFEENFDESYRRSWGERLTYHVGCAYLVGANAASYGRTLACPSPELLRQRSHARVAPHPRHATVPQVCLAAASSA